LSTPRTTGSVSSTRHKVDPNSRRQRVLSYVLSTPGTVTPASVGRALKIATTQAGGLLKHFADTGKIERPGYGKYQRPSSTGGAS
jgi:hypothetical protein